jgi:LacI family transcriptional regulator
MGFGGLELSAACSPTLSTVQEPFFDIGYQMLKILHDLIQGRSVPQHLQLPARLLQRESTAERLPAT